MGPTASGKTALALELAKAAGGELISVDSRQIYTRLSAGTAKPEGLWQESGGTRLYLVEGVPCHLVDFMDPRISYDAGSFVAAALAAEAQIRARGRRPIFAGGTGMYIQAYWNGMDSLPKGDPELRKSLSRMAEQLGSAALHARLRAADPEAAEKIPQGNVQRIIRALEVRELTGIPISRLWTRQFYGTLPAHKAAFCVLNWARPLLRERIAARTRAIFDAMAAETDALLKAGYPEDCPALKSLGYPQMLDYLRSRISKTDAMHRIIALTQAYAKRQMTWLRRYRNAAWIDIASEADWQPRAIARDILSGKLAAADAR